MMYRTKPYALACLLSLTVASPLLAQDSSKPSVIERELITLNAKVIAVDPGTRLVTLQNEKGEINQIVAGEEVANFAQIDVGDEVVTQVYQAVAIEVTETDSKILSTQVTTDTARVEPGQKPGGIMINQITVTAEVMQVDKAAQTVTIKRQQQGEPSIVLQTVDVPNPASLENIDPGDMVVMTYQRSVAISVQEIP